MHSAWYSFRVNCWHSFDYEIFNKEQKMNTKQLLERGGILSFSVILLILLSISSFGQKEPNFLIEGTDVYFVNDTFEGIKDDADDYKYPLIKGQFFISPVTDEKYEIIKDVNDGSVYYQSSGGDVFSSVGSI